MQCRIIAAGLIVMAMPGCGSPFQGQPPPDTTLLMQATLYAGETGDRSQIPALVTLLDHDDALVRMMSIQALERLTGTRMGYHPYGSAVERLSGVERWRLAVESGKWGSDTPADTPTQ